MLKVIVHPTCPSSRSLLLGLEERGLLGKVDVVVAVDPWRSTSISRGIVWSVPWVIRDDGTPIAADPVSTDELEVIIQGGDMNISKDPMDAFVEAVLHSGYATVVSLLHESLEPVLDLGFVSAALRSPLTHEDPDAFIKSVRRELDSLYSRIRGKLLRAAAIGFARDLYWALGRRIDGETLGRAATSWNVATWMIAKASIGRIGLPSIPGKPRAAGEIADFLARTSNGLARRIRKEQEEIVSDERFNEILRALSDRGL